MTKKYRSATQSKVGKNLLIFPPELVAVLHSRPKILRWWKRQPKKVQRQLILFYIASEDLRGRHRRLNQIAQLTSQTYRRLHGLP